MFEGIPTLEEMEAMKEARKNAPPPRIEQIMNLVLPNKHKKIHKAHRVKLLNAMLDFASIASDYDLARQCEDKLRDVASEAFDLSAVLAVSKFRGGEVDDDVDIDEYYGEQVGDDVSCGNSDMIMRFMMSSSIDIEFTESPTTSDDQYHAYQITISTNDQFLPDEQLDDKYGQVYYSSNEAVANLGDRCRAWLAEAKPHNYWDYDDEWLVV